MCERERENRLSIGSSSGCGGRTRWRTNDAIEGRVLLLSREPEIEKNGSDNEEKADLKIGKNREHNEPDDAPERDAKRAAIDGVREIC